jgi:hypothetical protein
VTERRRSAAALPLPLLLLTACVTGSYRHVSVDEPVALTTLTALQPGTHDLATCLARLGAPHRVLEYHVAPDRTSGMALVWTWRDAAGFGVEVSGGQEDVNVSFEYEALQTDLPGCVLWFGPDLVLERWRHGNLGELLATRRRPAPGDGG